MQLIDFELNRGDDAIIGWSLEPPAAIGGMEIHFQATKRFGGSVVLIDKSIASGYGAGQSGVFIINSGQGRLNFSLNSADTSGQDFGNISYTIKRFDSGNMTSFTEGYLVLTP